MTDPDDPVMKELRELRFEVQCAFFTGMASLAVIVVLLVVLCFKS